MKWTYTLCNFPASNCSVISAFRHFGYGNWLIQHWFTIFGVILWCLPLVCPYHLTLMFQTAMRYETYHNLYRLNILIHEARGIFLSLWHSDCQDDGKSLFHHEYWNPLHSVSALFLRFGFTGRDFACGDIFTPVGKYLPLVIEYHWCQMVAFTCIWRRVGKLITSLQNAFWSDILPLYSVRFVK